jgi:PhzF family phenazine biosynthesis protein
MKIEYFHVDAFTDAVFGGNPAGVCLLDEWLPAAMMEKIAAENRHSETAFLIAADNHYEIRWFTPKMEVSLCGHATLASAHVLYDHKGHAGSRIDFQSRFDHLAVEKDGGLLYLDFPSQPVSTIEAPSGLEPALGEKPLEVLGERRYLVRLDSEKIVRDLKPDMDLLSKIDKPVIVTAPGVEADFVSRFFAPAFGIPEDPVTGSAHCTLIPYWSQKLGKKKLTAFQASARGGRLYCEDKGERVKIGGKAVTYMQGWIEV